MISLVGLNKADVLAVLYNNAKPQGMGFLHYDPNPMTKEEAETLLRQTTYFDYLKGRVMKVDLSGEKLDPLLYNRDNGQGAAECAVAALRATGDINPSTVQTTHHANTLKSAEKVKAHLDEKSRIEHGEHGDITTLHLGLSDVADKIEPVVDNITKKHEV